MPLFHQETQHGDQSPKIGINADIVVQLFYQVLHITTVHFYSELFQWYIRVNVLVELCVALSVLVRHTHTTLLLEAGANPLDVQERLGHSHLAITWRYAHNTDAIREQTHKILSTIYK